MGTKTTSAVDSGEEYLSLTALDDSSPFGASASYIVYAQLEHSTSASDPALAPNTLGLYVGTALPDDATSPSRNVAWQIGTATTNSASEISGVTQRWHGGDIDDVAYVPDSDSPYTVDPTDTDIKKNRSVQFVPLRGVYTGDLQAYQFDAHSTYPINSYTLLGDAIDEYEILVRYRDEDDQATLRYADLSAFNAFSAKTAFNPGAGFFWNHTIEQHDDRKSPSPNDKAADRILACVDGASWA